MWKRWTETSVILGIINHQEPIPELDRRVVYNFKRSNKESCEKIQQINDLTDEESDCVNNDNWTEWSPVWSESYARFQNLTSAQREFDLKSQVWFQTKIAWPEVQCPLYYFNFEIAQFNSPNTKVLKYFSHSLIKRCDWWIHRTADSQSDKGRIGEYWNGNAMRGM